jgi:hypothetical protein
MRFRLITISVFISASFSVCLRAAPHLGKVRSSLTAELLLARDGVDSFGQRTPPLTVRKQSFVEKARKTDGSGGE